MRKATTLLLAAILLLAVLPSASASDGGVFPEPVPVEPAFTVLVDRLHQHIILGLGADEDRIVVLAMDGSPVSSHSVPGRLHSLSIDSERLWVAEDKDNYDIAIVGYSTDSFAELYRFELPQYSRVTDIVETAGKLVYSLWYGGRELHVLDLEVGGPSSIFTGGPWDSAELDVSAAAPGMVVAQSSSQPGLFVLDVSGAEVVVTAQRDGVSGYGPSGPSISPDASQFVIGDGAAYLTSDLRSAGKYGDTGGAVWSADGTHLIIGNALYRNGIFDSHWHGPSDSVGVHLSDDGSQAILYEHDEAEGLLWFLDTSYTYGSITGTVRDTTGAYHSNGVVDVYDESMSLLATLERSWESIWWTGPIRPGAYHLLFRPKEGGGHFASWHGGAPLLRPDLSVPVVVEDGASVRVDAIVRPHFTDAEDSVFAADIFWMADAGITSGCNPPLSTLYCPDFAVTRGQMAAFLVRALRLTDRGDVGFTDDDFSIFEADIEKLATAGITKGCNPPHNTLFCPDDLVTRGQMAAFLHRALGDVLLEGEAVEFADDDLSIFEADIEWLGSVGVTKGCNPPDNTLFCPDEPVTRAQMAAFLRRALG